MTLPTEQQVPSHVYKYRGLDDYEVAPGLSYHETLRRIFVRNEIWYASPATYNDPFDSRVHLEFGPGVTPDKAQAMIGDIQRAVDEIGVFTVSTKNDDILMWSYYAGGHSGICLEFELMESFFKMVQPVTYSATYPTVGATDPKVQRMKANLLTKSSMWKHESEWRVIDTEGGPGYRQFNPTLLTGVILGARISPRNESMVRGWIAEGRAEPNLYRAIVKPTEYGLDIVTA